ncbi:alkaline phosphatase [Thalassolituus sp.]|uniref:alkaline phosphatase n=1 Tax=Thalassolituus sp. TaxID=2030822 RepID=UPI0035137B9B
MKLNIIYTAVLAATMTLAGCGGEDGKNGKDGVNGTDGTNGTNGIDGSNGAEGAPGLDAPAPAVKLSDVLSNTKNSDWFIQASEKVSDTQKAVDSIIAEAGSAKNIILFVGDGMGVSTVTASRILEGQTRGMSGEENSLSFDKFPFAGLSKTYNVDAQTPDSAGTMTAMMSGAKTDVGTIGVDEDIARGDCASVAGNELATALELAEIAGMSTGIISTARITHATPAATYAKSADRNWEDNSDMPETGADACEDIASQLVNFEANLEARHAGATLDVDGIEVVMGGGRRHFLPKDAAANSPDAVSSTEGDRTDGRNLVTEWTTTYSTESDFYVYDQAGFDAIDTEATTHLFGLFNESHMQYEADRANDIAGEPSLAEMTEKAIKILDNNENGFFLMVESGRIDHAHHAGNAYNALQDTIELSEAVAIADELTNNRDTLIIVTADHGHVFTIAGYPKRGNPILGKVVAVGADEPSLASDGMPYTTVNYMNGRGHVAVDPSETDADAGYSAAIYTGRVDLTSVDTTAPGFHQEALVPLSSETHSGEDVGIYAKGPGAHLVTGTNEQSIIFHVMNHAGDLAARANSVVNPD